MSYGSKGGHGYGNNQKRRSGGSSNYKGHKIQFETAEGRFFARSPDISRQLLGYGKSQREALEEAKHSIDLIDSIPKITLMKNDFGHLHVFKGKPELNTAHTNNITYKDGKESDIYLQSQADVEEMEAYLTEDQKEQLNNGYPVTIKDNGPFF